MVLWIGLARIYDDRVSKSITLPLENHFRVLASLCVLGGEDGCIVVIELDAPPRRFPCPRATGEPFGEHLDAYVAPEPDAPVFTRPSGALRRVDLSNEWRAACARGRPRRGSGHDLYDHAAPFMARAPNVTLKELMAAIGCASSAAALRDQHATQKRSREFAS